MKISLIKYLIFIILCLLFFLWFYKVNLDIPKSEGILTLIISTTSITVAILITYFFSKIFSERQDRIIRKAKIDEYSKKITALSRVSHHLKSNFSFWSSLAKMKQLLDKKYEHLTTYKFREHKELAKLTEELNGELAPQAYLSLRDLEDNEVSSYEFYKSFKLKNYSIETLAGFEEYCGFIWSFFEEYKDSLSFTGTSSLHLKPIKENFSLIFHRPIDEGNLVKELSNLFSEYQCKIIPEMLFLTSLNKRKLSTPFNWIIINLIIYIFLMLASLSLFIMPLELNINMIFIKIILAVFCANTIDLVVGLLIGVKQELNIKDFYKI